MRAVLPGLTILYVAELSEFTFPNFCCLFLQDRTYGPPGQESSYPGKECALECALNQMAKVIVYSKPDCCLCDQVKQQLRRLGIENQFSIREIDIHI